ncbi:cAMP-binding domain of CRP or a regulatory subunit of cAMP-dependent protein kinases [Filimonas lacunae]|uniref:cAMP-binding domain of CRP or a regulatory subunit of cAMP-dependent protein kinases n=1 Tax=Filimonas lacunae TaxID=477680 RepID=A0A173MEW2_9BACT|nr:Crp/Fnr family transcriptional regulator [Filimonas lacunae]BAV06143.1 Crp/Fnr family transcriptional regulator [Filimonas lacunae]SIT24868.1 cAMP-binding domain of CRP or a regulatory subunit of cAMP-dependent protein kinases [Filimonas lacunae]
METTDAAGYLKSIVAPFAGLTEADVSVSLSFWRKRDIIKGDFYNKQNVVCKDLGIVVKGIFRVYYYDPETSEEKNVFFFSEGQFIVSFRSFIYEYPCNYYIEALEDAEILYVSYPDLQNLYKNHKSWERFGRILAEHFFNQSQGRTEELLFLTHEQRYLNLLKQHPNIVQRVASFHLASFLGIKNPSLSRIKKRIQEGRK